MTSCQTHNVALTKPVAEYVVAFGTDGRIISQGAPEILADAHLTEEMRHEQEAIELEEDFDEESEANKASANGSKLIVAEEIQEGHVSFKAAKLLLVNLSSWPLLFWIGYLAGMFSVHGVVCASELKSLQVAGKHKERQNHPTYSNPPQL
jgi:hypothetical protein